MIDDESLIRDGIQSLIRSIGIRVEGFPSAQAFMDAKRIDAPACLILDVRMPGMSGPDLQRWLAANSNRLPIIFITAHGDDDVVSRVMADGAVDCLLKPFTEDSLLRAISVSLAN